MEQISNFEIHQGRRPGTRHRSKLRLHPDPVWCSGCFQDRQADPGDDRIHQASGKMPIGDRDRLAHGVAAILIFIEGINQQLDSRVPQASARADVVSNRRLCLHLQRAVWPSVVAGGCMT